MEIIYFFSAVARNIKTILVGSILITLLAGLYAFTAPTTYKTIVFASITTSATEGTTSEAVDPLSFVEAADRFTEAMVGWFRNPKLFEDIASNAPLAKDLDLPKLYKVRKQEKQNINIAFTVPSKTAAEELKDATLSYVRNRMQEVNKDSSTKFAIASESYTISPEKPSYIMYGGIAFVLSFVLLALLILLIELIRGTASFKDQVEKELGQEIIDKIKNKNDLSYLANYILKQQSICILAGVNKTYKNFGIDASTYISEVLGRDVILIDGDLKSRSLHNSLGLSDALKKMKGFTDAQDSSSKALHAVPVAKGNKHFKFIPAGTEKSPQIAKPLGDGKDQIIIHTSLPENPYVFQIQDAMLVLLVKLGTTKLQELRRIRHMTDGKIATFIVS